MDNNDIVAVTVAKPIVIYMLPFDIQMIPQVTQYIDNYYNYN